MQSGKAGTDTGGVGVNLHNTTKDAYIEEVVRSAAQEWESYVARCAVGNMRDLAQETGLVPRSFSVYGGPDNPLRLLLREFGWDV